MWTVIIVFYIVGAAAAWRLLLPRMAPAYRGLAIALLLWQILMLALWQNLEPPTEYERWLWNAASEWNIPATLAATQLALTGILALVAASLAPTRPRWQALYRLGVGLVFLYLALGEYLRLHETFHHLLVVYIVLGVAMGAATILLAVSASKGDARSHWSFLFGLALIGFGGLAIDEASGVCGPLGPLRLRGCVHFFPIEEAFEYLGAWFALVGVLGWLAKFAPRPRLRMQGLLCAAPWIIIAFFFLQALLPRLELRLIAKPAAVDFESGLSLHGYRIDQLGGSTQVRLYAKAAQAEYMGAGYAIHLVDAASGKSVAHREDWASGQQGNWLFGPDYAPIYLQWLEVAHAPTMPQNRALLIVLSLWREERGKFRDQAILSSDHPLLNDSQVILGEMVPQAAPSAAMADPLAKFSNGFTLSAVDLPATIGLGETLDITFAWRADEQGHEDLAQFLHLGHVESGEWHIFDQQPLGARLPTRLWYSGLVDEETWSAPLADDLEIGTYAVYTGLYRLGDKERIPASDAHGEPFRDARVPLGRLIIQR